MMSLQETGMTLRIPVFVRLIGCGGGGGVIGPEVNTARDDMAEVVAAKTVCKSDVHNVLRFLRGKKSAIERSRSCQLMRLLS